MADPGSHVIPWMATFDAPELKMKFMLNVSPKDLQSLCRTSRVYASICQDDYFWKQRLDIDSPQFVARSKVQKHLSDFQVQLPNNVQCKHK